MGETDRAQEGLDKIEFDCLSGKSQEWIIAVEAERDQLREARDILWDRAHDRGVAIERARDRLHALAGHHGGSAEIDAELRAIADALWASMQDAALTDAPRKGGE